MDKAQYYNSVIDQVKDLETLAGVQAERCFDLDKLAKMLPAETAAGIKRVILTGCGDSYSAAGAILPGFKKLSGLRACNSPDIMDFCCYYTPEKIAGGYAMDEVLVVGASASGNSQRTVEALLRGKELGAHTLIVTANPKSKGAETAELVFDLETPAGCNTPGLRSYYASLVGFAALGAYLGLCSGAIDRDRFDWVKAEIPAYTRRFLERLPEVDEQMFRHALRVKELTKFEIIGDWNEGYSAQFVEEKFIECSGVYCEHTNSEEFAHIGVFHREPKKWGIVALINRADPSLGRMKDSIYGCLAQHRPTLVVTDAAPETFLEEKRTENPPGYDSMAAKGTPEICQIPTPAELWLSPFVDFIPGSLLAGYHAAVNERKYFGGRYDFRTQTWAGR